MSNDRKGTCSVTNDGEEYLARSDKKKKSRLCLGKKEKFPVFCLT